MNAPIPPRRIQGLATKWPFREMVAAWSWGEPRYFIDEDLFISGSIGYTDPGQTRGSVQLFVRTQNGYVPTGHVIQGHAVDDLLGFAVDLSGDGTVMSIGSPAFNDAFMDGGMLQVLQWDAASHNNTWTQRGQRLVGTQTTLEHLGHATALSANGQVLVVSIPMDVAFSHKSQRGRVELLETPLAATKTMSYLVDLWLSRRTDLQWPLEQVPQRVLWIRLLCFME